MILNNEIETSNFAQDISKTLKADDILLLSGDLGSGKTFIVREIIQNLCGKNTKVISPTFNILQTYATPYFTIYHYDLYRLKSLDEIYELGIEEALSDNSICIIEWPEILESWLPKPYIKIHLEIIGIKRKCIKTIIT
ncbi:MAG: tRNA (adenosine(37)-N6)-threonylcarbamoyltransferase complex ATPase subunit type 1 TsaE [Janthinobacterium lividum]